MLQLLGEGLGLDIRELVKQKKSVEPSHSTSSRPTPDELAANYEIDPQLVLPTPKFVWIFDDVLTTGAHFRAMKQVIRGLYPEMPYIGIFLARRVLDADEL